MLGISPESVPTRRPHARRRRLARRSGGPRISAAGEHAARGLVGHRLVRAARRRSISADGRSAPFPQLLAALARGEDVVVLGRRHASACCRRSGCGATPRSPRSATAEGDASGSAARRRRCSTRCWPRSRPIAYDDAFERVRAELQRSAASQAARRAGRRFTGTLRDYQREALGWFEFLRRFGFGGCLADDMGLGKTVRCWRCSRRGARQEERRSRIAVARRRAAIARVQLDGGGGAVRAGAAVLDYTGPCARCAGRSASADLVLTTYGTLRRDAASFERDRVRLRDPRRGAGDQERDDRVGEGGAAAARAASPGADRHAGREPPRRAVEPVRVP